MSAAWALSGLAPGMLRVAAAELWLSTIVCAVVWGLCRMLRGRRPSLEQALWVLVLVRLFLPPSLAQPLGLGSVIQAVRAALAAPALVRPDADPGNGAGLEAAGSGSVRKSAANAGAGLLLLAWVSGSALLLARDRLAVRRCRHLLRRRAPASDPRLQRQLERWQRRLERWRVRLGCRRRVRLFLTDAGVSPFTLGTLRPVIVIPQRLLSTGGSLAVEAALAHELAHVVRWDALWLRLQRLAGRLYFFHPVVWLTSARLEAGRERLTDDLVVSSGLMKSRDYARGVVDVLHLDLRGVGAPGLLTSQRRTAMRIRTILATGASRRSGRLASLGAAALVGAFLLPLGSTATAHDAAAPVAASATRLASPLPGSSVSMPFGDATHPITGAPYRHTGVDLVAPVGTPVLAAGDGVVETATSKYGPLASAGTVVVIDHPGDLKTFYAHLGTLSVKAGQRVTRGQRLAAVGLSGTTTGPHVHFEVWRQGDPIDPAGLVDGMPSHP